MVMNLSYRKKTIKEVIHTLNTMEDGETLKIGMGDVWHTYTSTTTVYSRMNHINNNMGDVWHANNNWW